MASDAPSSFLATSSKLPAALFLVAILLLVARLATSSNALEPLVAMPLVLAASS